MKPETRKTNENEPILRPLGRQGSAALVALLSLILMAASCSSTASEPSAGPSDDAAADTVVGGTEAAEAEGDTEAPDDDASSSETTVEPDSARALADSVADGITQIVIDSTIDDYFVLYVRPDPAGELEIPVSVTLGAEGQTVLTDGRQQLPEGQYRVETYSITAPADVDGDGIDDLTELADELGSPLNSGDQLSIEDGTIIVSDREVFELLSYQGDEVMVDSYLAGLEFVKFYIVGADTENPTLYFMNTVTHRGHPLFADAIGLPGGRRPSAGSMRGDIVYNPDGIAPDGTLGTYRFAFQPNDAFSFEEIALAFEMLSTGMPFLTDNLLYEPYPQAALPLYEREQASYDAYRVPILLDETAS